MPLSFHGDLGLPAASRWRVRDAWTDSELALGAEERSSRVGMTNLARNVPAHGVEVMILSKIREPALKLDDDTGYSARLRHGDASAIWPDTSQGVHLFSLWGKNHSWGNEGPDGPWGESNRSRPMFVWGNVPSSVRAWTARQPQTVLGAVSTQL